MHQFRAARVRRDAVRLYAVDTRLPRGGYLRFELDDTVVVSSSARLAMAVWLSLACAQLDCGPGPHPLTEILRYAAATP